MVCGEGGSLLPQHPNHAKPPKLAVQEISPKERILPDELIIICTPLAPTYRNTTARRTHSSRGEERRERVRRREQIDRIMASKPAFLTEFEQKREKLIKKNRKTMEELGLFSHKAAVEKEAAAKSPPVKSPTAAAEVGLCTAVECS
jgi:hypothetical protein